VSGGPLRLEGVEIRLAGRVLLRIDALVEPGRVLSVMGPSGSGKSTLLAFISGTLDPAFEASGRVRIGARDVTALPPEARGIGIQFQDDLLFPHLSVGANLAFGIPKSPAMSRATRRARIDAALADAGLAGFAERDPATLSGGQRARAALMRTLLAEPRALLLDEPFNKLDAGLRHEFRRFVFDHAAARGLPTVLVTHDERDAADAGGPVERLAGGA
jgi:putative thiamine transport system ATP-binding protein